MGAEPERPGESVVGVALHHLLGMAASWARAISQRCTIRQSAAQIGTGAINLMEDGDLGALISPSVY